ncbi:MAG TPA: DUF998 domain-containing protein [Actinomycetales bacterium]|nr:DUF998 domain-containing protein [Actinomycetales bacterium]
MPVSTRTLALTSATSLSAFAAVVVLLNLVQHSDYSARSQAMSELALGRGGGLMLVAFVLMGAGTFALAVVLRRELPHATIAPVVLAVAALLDVVSAFFHTNRTGEPATTTSTIHQIAGISTFVLVMVAIVATVRHLRRSPRWSPYTVPTVCWSLVCIAAFFLIPVLGDASFGLAQRIFVATWLSWMITAALVASRLNDRRALSEMARTTADRARA